MNRDQLLDKASEYYAGLISLMKRKSEGYTGAEDPYSTYSFGADLAGISTEQSIVARLGEKFKRFENGWGDTQVLEECAEDIPNLLFMLLVWRREQAGADNREFQPPEGWGERPAEEFQPPEEEKPKYNITNLLQKLGLNS